jgi:uncharacterized protein
MRVFLDANILFSAADSQSATRQLLNELLDRAEVVTSPHTLEEARRNLQIKRPQHLGGLAAIQRRITITAAFDSQIQVQLPQEDIPVVAGASGSGCSHLWTSDRRHFGRYYGRRIGGVLVVSSMMLADLLNEAE